jgi:capsular exopolysaccharide synthesis family protein
VRNAILGAVLGLLVGLALAVVVERLDRRLRTPEELVDVYGLPMLGIVPLHRAFATSANGALPPGATEAFRMLRARLRYFNVDRDIQTVLVTSPAPKDGKSTVAWHLARTAAMSARTRVILIEADFRRPVMAHAHGLRGVPGLAEALTHGVALPDVIQRVPITEQPADAGGPALDVIVAGAPPPNPAELIESHKMADVLKELATRYDLVVIDTPPSSVVSDAFPLIRQVSGVIVVSSLNQTSREAAVHLRDQLHELSAHALGVIANRVKSPRADYYGGYYTDGDYQQTDAATPSTASGDFGTNGHKSAAVVRAPE